MKHPITLKILVTVNDMAHFDACTLCFKSLRVGWPTANIHVYVNGRDHFENVFDKLGTDILSSQAPSCHIHGIDLRTLHPNWIQRQINEDYPGPLIIADADTVFWKSCEDWEFPEEILLAGYYNPRMFNDFARCISVPRIHTSLLVFPDTNSLRCAVQGAYTEAWKEHGDYCPCDPFMGQVMFDEGKPVFWDCCANLYNMLQRVPASVYHFGEKEKACYDHLNSASFYDVMSTRLEGLNREGFIKAHTEWVKNPRPGLWPLADEYYRQKEIEGWVYENSSKTLKV